MSSPAVVGIFGKHPEHCDFVRWGGVGTHCAGFETWIGAEQARIPGRAKSASERATRFAVKRAGSPRLLTGSWIESCDAVGRRFPLIGYTEVEVARSAPLDLVSMATARFAEEMETILMHASSSRLNTDMQALLPLHDDEWASAAVRLELHVRTLSVRGWGERVFEGFATRIPSAIDSAVKLAEAVRRSPGQSIRARFVGAELQDLAIWMRLFGRVVAPEASAWIALWEPRGDVGVLCIGEPRADLVATLRPELGFRPRAWHFEPEYVRDLEGEDRAFLDRPLAEFLAQSSR